MPHPAPGNRGVYMLRRRIVWAYNRLLRLTLDELYGGQPDLRPTNEHVREMASRLGVNLPQTADEVA